MPTRTEFEKAFHDVAEGRDPDEEVDVGGEPLPAMRVVRELLTSTSIMPHAAWSNLGLERGSTYADGAEAVLEGWREAGLVADGAQTMPEERQQEPVDKLERFRVEKLERIGPFAADDLERITLDRFERGTVDDEGADVSLGDTETQGSPASGTKDDD
jgi:hypothetical protein